MKDFFEEKFENAILGYPGEHESEAIEARKKIAKIVEDSISSGEYGYFQPKTEKELTKALEICKDYEKDCDAVLNLQKYVFEAKNSSIFTFKRQQAGPMSEPRYPRLKDWQDCWK